MNKIWGLILFFFIGINVYTNAQTHGNIINAKDKQPIEGVNILQQRNSLGLGSSNSEGTFNLEILKGCNAEDTIIFSHIGYNSFKCTKNQLEKRKYKISLFEKAEILDEVTINVERVQPYYLQHELVGNMPKPLFATSSFIKDGKIYFIAGDNTHVYLASHPASHTVYDRWRSPYIYVYDIEKNEWEKKETLITARAYHNTCLHQNKIFILGGIRYSTNKRLDYTDESIEVYDLDKDILYSQASNIHQAKNAVSFVYDNLLFMAGGSTKEFVYNDKIHALDLNRGYWYEIATIPPQMRCESKGILVGNTVYFFGGKRGFKKLWDINSYNVETGEWKHLREMQESVSAAGLAQQGNLIFIYGEQSLQIYNITNNSIQSFPINIGKEYASIHIYKNILYIFGGCIQEGEWITPSDTIYRIDISHFM